MAALTFPGQRLRKLPYATRAFAAPPVRSTAATALSQRPSSAVAGMRSGGSATIAHAEVLQHDHRVSRGELAQQVFEARRELVRDQAVPAWRREHFHLQAPFALRKVDLRYEILRRDLDAGGREHGRERGRAALEFLLREERHLAQLGPFRKALRQRAAQLRGLRPHARATRQRERTGANKNARDYAGVLCGLSAELR